MADYKGILVIGEKQNGKLDPVTLELLGGGRKLADQLGEKLSLVMVGNDLPALSKEGIAHGADVVYSVDRPVFKEYQADTFLKAIQQVVSRASPDIILLGQTALGRDLAPRLAFRMKVPLSTDCLELAIDGQSRRLLQTRPVYGGCARAIFMTEANPQIATVRPKAMTALPKDDSRQGKVEEVAVDVDTAALKAKILERVKQTQEGIKLEDAEAIICGGRGLGGADGFELLKEVAKTIKGAVGASRPPCDSGWASTSMQIGLTGKIVSPNFYLAVGISGASQHMAGCSGARTIVAINKDAEANIFKEARFGVVGDYKQVLPAFLQKVKELTAG